MSILNRYDKKNENSIFSSIEKRRKSKVKDYTRLADGQIVYTGRYIYYEGSSLYPDLSIEKQINQVKIMSISMLLSFILMGFLKVPGMINTAWIILIYVIGLLSSILTVKACLSIKNPEKGLKEATFLKSIDLLPRRTVFCIIVEIIFLAAFIGNILFMIFNKSIEFSIQNGRFVFENTLEASTYFQGQYGEFSILFSIMFVALIFISGFLTRKINRIIRFQNWKSE